MHNGKPRIWQLVPERDLAWHAGVSFWRVPLLTAIGTDKTIHPLTRQKITPQ
jgi:hypothetical protein